MLDKPDEVKVVGNTLLHSFTVKGKNQIRRFKKWIDAYTDESKPIWVPSRQDDFTLIGPPLSNKLTVKANNPSQKKHHIAVTYADGSRQLREITNITPHDDGSQELTLDQPLPAEPSIKQICYLWLCRIDFGHTVVEWDDTDTTRVLSALLN